jgi:hypothetical protein
VSFLSVLALAVALLVAAPYMAHRLRRRRAEEQAFPPARLVPPSPPKARRRSRLEDRALFATRAASVLLLALLGATPFVRCSRLSLQRSGGASVAMAIVVDDSMSMRARSPGASASRFDRARTGARELLASAREGDAIAVVLAGAPARVALAATTDLGAVRHAIDSLTESDRATDLEGGLSLARGLVSSLPQVDRRIVLLSDLADGHPDAAALGEGMSIPLWIALPELRGALPDCALTAADRGGARVQVHVACTPGSSAAGKEVSVEDAAGKVLGHAAATGTGNEAEISVQLPNDDAAPVLARLAAGDAIAADDVTPVLPEAGRGAVAVVADATEESVVTGGAPIVEQALSALKLDVDLRPLPAMPDRSEDLAGDVGLVLDDPSGLTPEQRHALGAFLDGGGVVLLALGPHAASAPLGASLEPILAHAPGWGEAKAAGADPATATGELVESARSLSDLGASRRASLAPEDAAVFESLVRWSDGAPLVARRAMGRGEAWLVTLPFSVDRSDLALRPAFLALLDGWVRAARERAAPKRSTVGTTWRFPGAQTVEATGPESPGGAALTTTRDDGVARLVPPLVGTYRITVDGKTETRVATPDPREVDLRPRPAASSTAGAGVGEQRAKVDASGEVALLLLAAVAGEMALRVWSRRKVEAV